MKKFEQACCLITILLIVVSLAIVRDGRIFGHDLQPKAQSASVDTTVATVGSDGTMQINTTSIAADVKGFGGPVPLVVSIKDGRIADITPLPNTETPEFFAQASTLFQQWKGKSVDEVAQTTVDAVSGATFSSNAIIANVQRAAVYASSHAPEMSQSKPSPWTLKHIVGFIVVLMAAFGPLVVKNRRYHTVQLALNAVVLGLWGGCCLSYASIIGFAANGIDVAASAVALVMIVTAFVYPLFGKKGYYCAHVCPFGALQQLASQCNKHKRTISPNVAGHLDSVRRGLWALLMLFIWTGVWTSWVDYEPFTAFAFGTATWAAIVIAAAFIVLSFFVHRPYCRFVCPMGTLLRLSQATK